jgi:hypothetical protein
VNCSILGIAPKNGHDNFEMLSTLTCVRHGLSYPFPVRSKIEGTPTQTCRCSLIPFFQLVPPNVLSLGRKRGRGERPTFQKRFGLFRFVSLATFSVALYYGTRYYGTRYHPILLQRYTFLETKSSQRLIQSFLVNEILLPRPFCRLWLMKK